MLKLKIISIGKTKEAWLEQAITEYVKRLTPVMQIEFVLAKDNAQLLTLLEKEPLYICCDANGQSFTSEEFSTYIHKKFTEGGSRLSIVIGGAEGLPPALKTHSNLISLSPLTMTHQIVRLILIEQIYRALEIGKGTNYHK